MSYILREESIMGLRGVLRAEAHVQGYEAACNKFLRELGRQNPETEGRQLASAIVDGLFYGNWPWVIVP